MRPNQTITICSTIHHIVVETFFKSGILFYLEFNLRLVYKLYRTQTDLITAIDLDTIPACTFSSFITKKKLTFDAHEIFYEVPELLGKPIKKGVWKLVARFFLPHVKHNYTVNASLAKHYARYNRAYKVIRNVPVSSSSNASKENTKQLVYLGVLNKGRGIELAIDAMKELPAYHLTLIGEGDISDQLKRQASGQKNITFLGYISPGELPSILDKASIGLNMLQAESLNYELSLANKFFDYMHAGLPSINMSFPEYKHILTEHKTGLMVDSYTATSLISAVRALEDAYTYQELHTNCYKYKAYYSWEKEQKKLLDIYSTAFNS